MPSEKVLIVGAGVAGSILAFFLAKHNYEVVVIERSKADQKMGQGIEIEEPALQVVKEMGVYETLKIRKTNEKGTEMVDEHDRTWALFKSDGGFSPTGDLELMRGDLTDVLYKAADAFPNVTYRFETTIQSLAQTPDKVLVDLQNRHNKDTTTEEFAFVVGADGQRSRTRQLIMAEQDGYFKRIGAYVSYFSIPKEARDEPYSRICNFPGRRIIWLRPVSDDSPYTSVYFIHAADNVPALRAANASGDRQRQKEVFAELYKDCGGEGARVVEQLLKAENFYSDELTQVRLPRWSEQRVALVGDAAWAPTPFTGEGNQLAIIGAFVLAQEMGRNRGMVAFEKYEKRLRKYVENAQEIPGWGYMPKLLNPETVWGIWVLRSFFWVLGMVVGLISWLDLTKHFAGTETHRSFDLEIEKTETKAG